MKLKIIASLFTLCLAATLFADPTATPTTGPTTLSDLSATSLNEFTNAIDWTAGPNDQFNKQKNDFILGGLDFTSSTGNVGYYKSGNIPFALRGQFAAAHESKIKITGVSTTDYPVFKNVNYDFAGTLGLPSVNNLSIGLDLNEDYSNSGYTTTTSAGATTDVTKNNSKFTVAVPVGFQINAMYNYGFLSVSHTAGKPLASSSVDGTTVTVFDKLRFQSLIKGGTETAVWVNPSFSGTSIKAENTSNGITEKITSDIDVKAINAGISNRIDIPVADGINFVFDPFVSATITGTSESTKTTVPGYSSSVDTGEIDTHFEIGAMLALEAKFSGTPLSVYAGVKPHAYLDTRSEDDDSQTSGSFSIKETTDNANLLTIVAALPSAVSIDFTVATNSTYKIECVIPLKPFGSNSVKETAAPATAPAAAPAAAPASAPAPKSATTTTPASAATPAKR